MPSCIASLSLKQKRYMQRVTASVSSMTAELIDEYVEPMLACISCVLVGKQMCYGQCKFFSLQINQSHLVPYDT